MRILDLTALPHPAGNRIDLRWRLPVDAPFDHVRVVRRAGTHPTTPNPASAAEGVVVPEREGGGAATDTGLRGETVYYYSLYPYRLPLADDGAIAVSDPAEQLDRFNRTSAMATSPLGLADEMYGLLPALYHRYDTRGALRRFLDLPGGQLDQIYSYARALLDSLNLDRVDGRLLPLLAQWIGWQTDYGLDVAAQRNEIRHAPYLYQAVGLVPAVQATVQRIGGQHSRIKEFVHNVAATNRPPRFNLWQRVRQDNDWGEAALVSLDAAFGGRPVVVTPSQGPTRLFYEREEADRCQIWTKALDERGAWGPSAPVSTSPLTQKEPSAAPLGDDLVLFWSAYDRVSGRWLIESSRLHGGAWSAPSPFVPPGGTPDDQRRKPAVVSDGTGIWLFWLERGADGGWQARYNRYNGTTWQASPSPSLPSGAAGDPPMLDDLIAVFHPTDPAQRLWLSWAGLTPTTSEQAAGLPRQTRWTLAYRVKAGLDPSADDWSQTRTLPKPEPAPGPPHDREPYPVVRADGSLDVFWSSDRGGQLAIWQATLDRATHAWGEPTQVATSAEATRAPLVFSQANATRLVFRSSESVRYIGGLYGAVQTVDSRYAGSSTLQTRDTRALARRGTFDDTGTYLYDTGRGGVRTDDDWYARDTIGVYLAGATDEAQQSRLRLVLRELMPLTDRAVFIKDAEAPHA